MKKRTSAPKPLTEESPYLTIAEASSLVRTPAKSIVRWIAERKIPTYKPGRLTLIKKSELLAFVESTRRAAHSEGEKE